MRLEELQNAVVINLKIMFKNGVHLTFPSQLFFYFAGLTSLTNAQNGYKEDPEDH